MEHEPQEPSGGQPAGDINEEIRNLGKNFEELFRSLWESEERRKIQQEISESLRQAGESMKNVADDISNSEASQRLRSEVNEFQRRVETGEAQAQFRQDIIDALRKANESLANTSDRIRSRSAQSENETPVE